MCSNYLLVGGKHFTTQQPLTDRHKTNIMEEVLIKNKQKYLYDNYPFEDSPKLTDKKCCIHCNTIFKVGDYKVFKDKRCDEFIYCPNAPTCNGTVIDWFSLD